MIFQYKAFEKNKLIKGTMEAQSREEVLFSLKSKGLRPVKIEEDIGTSHAIAFSSKFTKKDYVLLFQQLSILLDSGISFDRSIDMVAGQYQKKKRVVLKEIHRHLISGESLWNSFQLTNAFSPFIYNMIEVGERSSNLSTIFFKLSHFYKKQDEFRKKMVTSLTYPILLVVVTFCILNFLLLEVIPGFEEIFQEAGHLLPFPTRIVLAISRFWRNYDIFFMIGIMIVALSCFVYYKKSPYVFHKYQFRSKRFTKNKCLQFSFAMSILLSSGMTMEEALLVLKAMENNVYMKEKLGQVVSEIQNGEDFTQACEKQKIFPSMMISMVKIGEESSNLPFMFQSIYEFYNSEMEIENQRLLTLIEPIFILVLSIVVGFIVIAIAFPIFDMANQM